MHLRLTPFCVLGLALGARADVIDFTATVPLQTTSWSEIISVQRFDPALGSLESVRVTVSTLIQGSARFESLDAAPTIVQLDFTADVSVSSPALPSINLIAEPLFSESTMVSAFDGTIDFAGTSGAEFVGLSATDAAAFDFVAPLTPVQLSQFVGVGSIPFTVQAAGTSTFLGAGNAVINFQQEASAQVTIEYTFTPPPDLMDCNGNDVLDEEDIAFGTSEDCNSNGIPDECEPDCDADGIPDACQPRSCPCTEVNRRLPGSLLLFPEYVNRPGELTILTVTNTNCEAFTDGVRVEIRYIDEESCLETDRSFDLTLCDTLTVLISAHTPDERGYAYAFAKSTDSSVANPGGEPIAYNHLVGQALHVSGLSTLEYSTNAVAFRSPLLDGQPTDRDGPVLLGDGVRDLDGLEYDPAPDRVLIPRFLGQDNSPTGVQSDLVLVALSGGLQFKSSPALPGGGTTIRVLGYNDNEVPFAVTHTFSCWDKLGLQEISSAFRNTSLQALGHDPEEIVGYPSRESGWMIVFGDSAVSPVETILDPAIYAVLVEKTRGQLASDLPFEYCSQFNGDLLPNNLFGDHPHIVGDNQ